MIPKVIHYCWFGENEKPDLVKKCIDSWKRWCPDYEIKEWNEKNWNVNKFQYTKEAYEKKKWAFVSDVARLDIVYRYGGFYLDTDVELKTSLDLLCQYSGVMFFEGMVSIASGLGFGAEKANNYIQHIRDDYQNISFVKSNGKLDLLTCPRRNTMSLMEVLPDLNLNGKTQLINNFIFLSAKEYDNIAVNHCAGSWVDAYSLNVKSEIINNRLSKNQCVKRILRNEKLEKFIRKKCSHKIYNMYIFLSYDFLDMGIAYFIKKKIIEKRCKKG